MNNNNFSQITDQQTMTSMDIAEITGKNHFDVLKAIRKMEPAWEEAAASKFALGSYLDKNKQERPMYVLTKKECLFVATKFNDVARAKLVLRWEQLERERLAQPQQPVPQNGTPREQKAQSDTLPVDPRNMTRLQILQLALQAEEENERLKGEIQSLESDNYGLMLDNGQKEQQIQQLEQRTAYMNSIMADGTSMTVSQIAQDYGMGAPSFNNLLKGLGIQRKVGDQWILYADFLNRGYVATRMIPIRHAGGQDTYKPLTCWTQLGRKFLYDRLKRHGVLPLVERTAAAALPSPTTTVGTRQGC